MECQLGRGERGGEGEEEVTGKTNEDRNRDGDGDWDYFAIATVAKSVKVKFVRQKAEGGRRSRAEEEEKAVERKGGRRRTQRTGLGWKKLMAHPRNTHTQSERRSKKKTGAAGVDNTKQLIKGKLNKQPRRERKGVGGKTGGGRATQLTELQTETATL